MWPKSAGSADRSRLGHAPEMLDVQIEAIEPADQLERRRRASTDDADGNIEFPAGGIFLERIEHGDPNGGDTASNSHMFADHQAEHAFWIDIRTGENQARAQHGAGERQTPGVGMEHRSAWKEGIKTAHAKNFVEAATEGMQNQGAMGIDDALGMTGCAGREAHGGAIVFIDRRIAKIIAGLREQFLVVQET